MGALQLQLLELGWLSPVWIYSSVWLKAGTVQNLSCWGEDFSVHLSLPCPSAVKFPWMSGVWVGERYLKKFLAKGGNVTFLANMTSSKRKQVRFNILFCEKTPPDIQNHNSCRCASLTLLFICQMLQVLRGSLCASPCAEPTGTCRIGRAI